jgi:hypothetical protein
MFDRALRGEPSAITDVAYVTADRGSRPGILRMAPLLNPTGDVIGVIALMGWDNGQP